MSHLPRVTQLEAVGQHNWTMVSEMAVHVLKHRVEP